MITNFTDNTVKLKYPSKYAHLAPKILEHECGFQLSDVDSASANAIVRTLTGEMAVKYLDATRIETDDPLFMHEAVVMRLRAIPIMQSLKIGTKFTLKTHNKMPFIVPIKTSEFGAQNSFNSNITIWGLSKGATCEITCVVAEAYPYMDTYGGLSLATQVVALPRDIEPLNVYTRQGAPSATADPRAWDVHFYTHGTIGARELVLTALSNLIDRIQRVDEFIAIKTIIGDVSTYRITDESETIGNLFVKCLTSHYAINSATYDMDEDTCVLRVFAEDSDDLVRQCIERLSILFGGLKKQL